MSVSHTIEKAISCHQAGQLQEAEDLYKSVLQQQPQHPDALHLLGVIAHQVGKSDIAVKLIDAAININPMAPVFYNNCGEAYRALHNSELAVTRFKQALAINPDYAEAHNNLGIIYKELGKRDEAINCFQNAIASKPRYIDALNNMGLVLQETGNLDAAIKYYQQALSIKPDFFEGHHNIAISLKDLSRSEEAIHHLEKSITINPDCPEVYNSLGSLYQELGKTQQAINYYQQAIKIKPDYAEAYRHLSLIGPEKQHIIEIEKLLNKKELTDKDAMHLHYAVGHLLDKENCCSKSFPHFLEANKLKRKSIKYDSQSHSEYVERVIKVYSERFVDDKKNLGSDSQLPVFIIGMPRSGTTLVEQIISSHPQVYGAGELPYMRQIEKEIKKEFESIASYPECLSTINNSVYKVYAESYLNKLNKYSEQARHVSDKMPGNFLRLGLIKILFPRAKVVHCRRNAMDTCTSIFFNYFVNGNEYSFDLDDLGKYYLDYAKLMTHWHDLFTAEIFEVKYEDLVTDQENISKQLIEYLDLEWDEKCLDFYKNDRVVKTTSNVLVRQPVFKNAIERWKRYEDQLQPLFRILKPVI